MAPSKVSSKVSLSQAERQEPRMVWNNTNINTVRDSQPSASTPSPAAAQADSITARQLWQVIMRTQQVKLDLNLAEISAAWPTYPRPTIFALEQQLAGFRRHARAGNSVVLRRGDINVAMSAQAAADALAAATNEQIHVSSVHGGATGQTTSNATAHAHPPLSTTPGDQAMAGPSSTSFHAVNGGNAGWCSLPPLQINRPKESQVPTTSGGLPLARLPAPDQPARALALSRIESRRIVTRAYRPYPPVARRYVPYCDCGSLDCFHCYEKIMARR